MPSLYNRIAGQNLERLAALSDGVFAGAMTLLVLDLRAPAAEAIHSEHDLVTALSALAPRLITYLMSFITLGIFWFGQQTQLDRLDKSDRDLAWLHMAFMFAVTLLPFTTALLSELITLRTALLVYWGNILLLGVLLYATWRYAARAKLIRGDTPEEVTAAICRRIVIAQSFYAFGAVLCVYSTYLSIAFIALVQLNYVLAPRWARS
jgi:uncharacterized membrane protein